jgi:hypothetical protein
MSSSRKLLKYTPMMRDYLVRLASEGLPDYEIANRLGIHRHTIRLWRLKDRQLCEEMQQAFDSCYETAVRIGILKLAKGVETSEVTEESVYINDKGEPIKRKEKKTINAPNLNAIKSIAKKYAPDLEISEETNTTNILKIDNMTYRELMEYRKNESLLDSIETTSNIIDKDKDEES